MRIIALIFMTILFIGAVSAYACYTYDDFSSGSLDTGKWEIRQDVEGEPLMEEYGVLNESGFVFHTQQNTIGDRRVYLFPKRTFTTGDILEYDFNVISKEGNYGQMVLLTGDQYIRMGIMGYSSGVQGYDELGLSHTKIEFQKNNLHLIRTAPSGLVLIDDLTLTNENGSYELYIGSFSGHNGRTHIDYDNFVLCSENLICGDVNNDSKLNSQDIIYLVNYLFKSGASPIPSQEIADVNNDENVTSEDVIYLVNHIFKSGPAPVCS
jgi:hypothetical protein